MDKVYGRPGTGAIEYARTNTAGLTREQAAPILRETLTGGSVEKRVKRCAACGFLWRDDSLRNTKRVCSDECKTAVKTLQRRQQRADKALLTGKVRRKKKWETSYIWWREYPYWLDEYEMLKSTWKYEVPHDDPLLDFVHSQRELVGEGNTKKKARKPGSEDEKAGRKFNTWTIGKMRG